jgi:hypothetical protein
MPIIPRSTAYRFALTIDRVKSRPSEFNLFGKTETHNGVANPVAERERLL